MAFSLGDKIQVHPNLMPDEERKRLESSKDSRVDQAMHQTVPDAGVIEGISKTVSGTKYLVRVFVSNKPQGAMRYYSEDQAKAQFKAS